MCVSDSLNQTQSAVRVKKLIRYRFSWSTLVVQFSSVRIVSVRIRYPVNHWSSISVVPNRPKVVGLLLKNFVQEYYETIPAFFEVNIYFGVQVQ